MQAGSDGTGPQTTAEPRVDEPDRGRERVGHDGTDREAGSSPPVPATGAALASPPGALREPDRRPPQAAIVLGVGLVWLSVALESGPFGFLLGVVPGALLLAGGVATLAIPDDARTRHLAALGGALGVLLGLPVLLVHGLGLGLVLTLLAGVALAAEGWITLGHTANTDDVPATPRTAASATQVGADDALLGLMVQTLPFYTAADRARIAGEIQEARALFSERGWSSNPASYHPAPPPPARPELRQRRFAGIGYEHLRFASGYEPDPDEPGRERWLARSANRNAHAWVLRHVDRPRPWLICIHGYQMGTPWMDFPVFDVKSLHRERGLNIAMPVLPLHGPRKRGRISGEHFISADFLDTIHAEAQAMWDIRSLLHWIRAEGGERVGVYGLSLGGYNTALLASLEDGLACAIAGIPATDFARLIWRHGAPSDLLATSAAGTSRDAVDELLRAVSPLEMAPRIDGRHRAIFGATGDQLVPADQVRDLWSHWDRPEIAWYPGAHVSFMLHRGVRKLVDRTLDEAGLQA